MTKIPQTIYPKSRRSTYLWLGGVSSLLLLLYLCALPASIFTDPTCVVLMDTKGQLLGAKIAKDGQWRFPPQEEIPDKFVQAITTFEDKRFFHHIGIDFRSLARACYQNLQQQKIVSGASTISMQVIRLARKGKARTLKEKVLEMILATRLEWRYDKQAVLALYTNNAPFGGNVVGLEAAAWRYYGKKPQLLTWSETATLAVLPNSPSLIHPGRNRKALSQKRNRLLDKMYAAGILDALSWELAKEEPLPDKPLPLPRFAPHLLARAIKEQVTPKNIGILPTTLDLSLQQEANKILAKHHDLLVGNDIHNAAALLIDIEQREVIAYVGNIANAGISHGAAVDIIRAPRSTGSILKPFLYAGALQAGQILPNTLLPDLPTHINGYQPKNFHETYDGVIPAKRALIRSLNIPFIRLLQKFGLEKFHFLLKKLGIQSINRPANYYGLPLILGGGESTLWEVTNAYAGMARTLTRFSTNSSQYIENDFDSATYLKEEKRNHPFLPEAPVLEAASIYYTLEAMRQLERPLASGNWEQFSSRQNIAWKTGTSIGFRDAWAIGVTPKYAIGVWVGNADGEGRPNLTGIQTAAPILFDLFDLLPNTEWFEPPLDEITTITTCANSGYRALPFCPIDSIAGPIAGLHIEACPYHKIIHLDESRTWQVNRQCKENTKIIHEPWFILPPGEAFYFQFKHPAYQNIPAFRQDCPPTEGNKNVPLQLIYPNATNRIYVPIDINGKPSRTVFKAAHQHPETTIYWHLNQVYVGSTQAFHQLALNPSSGQYLLTLVDEHGFQVEQTFEIVGR